MDVTLERIREVKEKGLTELDLSNLMLTKLPLEILELSNLIQLELRYNQLTELPPEIQQLTNLNWLSLHNNKLTILPPEIVQMNKLTALYLFDNRLTSLPPNFGQLINLNYLYLGGNELEELPPEIGQLVNLSELSSWGNKFITLPSEIGQLTNLTELNLGENQLTNLPSEIGQLTNLTKLKLSGNQLTSLPLEIGQLTNLTGLYLEGNQLTHIPSEITQLPNLKKLVLSDNPLVSPPIEIAERGIDAIRDYFKSLQEEKIPLNEVNIIFIGDGGAGKTSLMKRIIGKDFDPHESQTHGINIEHCTFSQNGAEFKVNLWDFGGQEIMHATHQFFLSKRSLYILVLDGRKDEKTEYWLKHAETFGGDSPVLIVMNKIDENPAFDLNRTFLNEKYKNIKGFYRLSCGSNSGVKEFISDLKEKLTKVELIQASWAKSWFEVKQQMENLTEHFISYNHFQGICNQKNMNEESVQNTVVDYLNDLGIVIHFSDFELSDTYILEPKWITNAVYNIITSPLLADSKGVFNLNLLNKIFQQSGGGLYSYPPDKYQYIINLMKKFELCYEMNSGTVLVPQLLAIEEKTLDDFDYQTALRFEIFYEDFLPMSVIPRFIAKMNKDIKDNYQWRTGVILEDKKGFKSTAIIKADYEARKINIYINGEQRREYLSIILFCFREINESFEKLKVREKVPMPDQPRITISYSHLLTLEKNGEINCWPEGSEKPYNVRELLGNYYHEKKNEAEVLDLVQKIGNKTGIAHEDSIKKKRAKATLEKFLLEFVKIGKEITVDLVAEVIKKSMFQ